MTPLDVHRSAVALDFEVRRFVIDDKSETYARGRIVVDGFVVDLAWWMGELHYVIRGVGARWLQYVICGVGARWASRDMSVTAQLELVVRRVAVEADALAERASMRNSARCSPRRYGR